MFRSGLSANGDPAVAAAKLAQQESVVDFIRGDLSRMRTLVPASARPASWTRSPTSIHAARVQHPVVA